MVKYTVKSYRAKDLILGFKGRRITFHWSPYSKRAKDHQEDYDRLLVSIYHNGLINPVLIYGKNVLVGQRRVEIMQRISPKEYIHCWDIQEDVSEWWKNDLWKLDWLKKQMTEVKY